MSTYIMSDIHGMYDKYLDMLKMIEFDYEKDELFILGDIFDRGPKPLEILEHIVSHKNIRLLLGNHEDFFIDFYETNRNLDIWFANGGRVTYEALIEKGQTYMDEVYKYLVKQRFYYTLNYGDFSYLLCHAGISVPHSSMLSTDKIDLETILECNSRDDFLWNRDHINTYNTLDSINVICGHTPTSLIPYMDLKTGVLVTGDSKIIRKDSFIYIDCGAPFLGGQLGCIQLKEKGYKTFYV